MSPIAHVAAALSMLPAQIAAPPAPPQPQRRLTAWEMGPARCGDAVATVIRRVTPMLSLSYVYGDATPDPVTMTFRIDADGRPLGIARVGTRYVQDGQDIAPSLAATRFAPGAREACRIVYTSRRSSLADASLADVRAFAIAPNIRPDAEVFRRTYPVGSDCFDPVPEVRLRGFPPFNDLPKQPGTLGWSMVQFDIDGAGRPVGATTVAGSGDAAFDRASLMAVVESRFEPKPRRGCVYPYYIRPGALAAPEPPEAASLRPAEATCPLQGDWATKPNLVYPAAYNRRGIEGWAIVAFDVAPWGATGNVRVLAAEPSADFGDAAMQIVRAATRAPSSTGYADCVERVRYRMSPKMPPEGDPPPPPAVD